MQVGKLHMWRKWTVADITADVCVGTNSSLELAAEETNQNLSCSGSEPLSNLSSQEEEPASPLASTLPGKAEKEKCQLSSQGEENSPSKVSQSLF